MLFYLVSPASLLMFFSYAFCLAELVSRSGIFERVGEGSCAVVFRRNTVVDKSSPVEYVRQTASEVDLAIGRSEGACCPSLPCPILFLLIGCSESFTKAGFQPINVEFGGRST